ncbi:MAG: molybdopterin-dependent oxidoreductase [Longimicrobiaceae bacterium]
MPELKDGTQGFLTRRGFVAVAASSALGALLANCSSPEGDALGFTPDAKRTTPFITPNGDFYLVAVDPSFRPAVTRQDVASKWALELVGLNKQGTRIGYDDLDARAKATTTYTFECIGNPVGGQLIGNAEWRVLPLREILERAPGGAGGVRAVMFRGLDDFYSSVSAERAMDEQAFLALGMNGVPLPAGHGFPARVILPNLYGMKQPRWLKSIELLADADTTSYWEERGWAGEVPVKTMSRLDPRGEVPGGEPVELTGIAFAGARGIRAVEVSLDDGGSWVPCELVTPTRPGVWSLWKYAWQQPTPGGHQIRVRATDGSGQVQTAEEQGTSPDGASGYDEMMLRLGSG